jgi:multiple sugar transport system substrate-binding protein
MEEIELSVMLHNAQTADVLQPLLKTFEAQSGVHVNLTLLDWSVARAELNKAALYHHGPDVSEIGSTWVSDMISMSVLSPFYPEELEHIGKAEEFVKAAWSTGKSPADDDLWAIPWHAETYVIHYRKDLLQQAGIDETTAFQTHAQISQTAAQLQKSGVDVPVELSLQSDRYGTLHAMASWIWGYGGQFLSADGKSVLLDKPKALEAIKAYFGLLKCASAAGREWMYEKGVTPLFHQGKAAIAFGTARLALPDYAVPEVLTKNWGWAPLPKPCFVGGSNLIIWNHTRNKRAALKLVKFLTEASTLGHVNPQLATLPPRLSVLKNPEFSENPMWSVMSSAIQTGHSYPAVKLWGLIEDKLVSALLQMGAEILMHPNTDLENIVQQYILPTTHRINLTLSQ